MKGPALLRIVKPLRRRIADRRVRLATAVAASLVCLAGVMAVGLQQTPQPAQVQMRNGTLWVASNQVGETASVLRPTRGRRSRPSAAGSPSAKPGPTAT